MEPTPLMGRERRVVMPASLPPHLQRLNLYSTQRALAFGPVAIITTQDSHNAAFQEFLRRVTRVLCRTLPGRIRRSVGALLSTYSSQHTIRPFASHRASTRRRRSCGPRSIMQNPASVETGAVHPVTYRWTSGWKPSGDTHGNLVVTCREEDSRRRRGSWNGAAGNNESDDDCDSPQRPRTTRAHTVASPTRVRLIYEDEDAKARVCGNVQRLLNVVQKDPESTTTNALVARKVLKYRRVMGRLDDVNVEDPDFDASAFFGIEWCRVGAPSS